VLLPCVHLPQWDLHHVAAAVIFSPLTGGPADPIGSAAKWKEEELALDPQSAGCLTRSHSTAEK
jgi:hypothetical protein